MHSFLFYLPPALMRQTCLSSRLKSELLSVAGEWLRAIQLHMSRRGGKISIEISAHSGRALRRSEFNQSHLPDAYTHATAYKME